MNELRNRRILLIDDMPSIHEDFRKILAAGPAAAELDDVEAALFGAPEPAAPDSFELDSAYQGREGVAMLEQALQAGRPYAMAFVDMRMPPGWDGVETIERLWRKDPRVQVVICTAYSDYSWAEVLTRLDARDRLLVLKKPFDMVEVRQLANILTAKWEMTEQAAARTEGLEQAVQLRTQELRNELSAGLHALAALQSANSNLRESEERYRLLVELAPDAILIEREGRIVFANPAAQVLYRAKQVEDLLGHSMPALAARDCARDVADGIAQLALDRGAHLSTEEQALGLDGSRIPVAVTRLAFAWQGQPAIQMVARELAGRPPVEQQSQRWTTHDTLTGLPNRDLLMDRLQQAIAHAQRNNDRLAVCFIDLDRFKWVNDSLGHAAGDELLKTAALRLSAALRASDTVARLGGDEFVLLLRGSGQARDIEIAIQRLVACLSEPMTLVGRELSMSCSVGCGIYPDDGTDADELLKFADAALYRAKEAGRYNLDSCDMEAPRQPGERQALEDDLRHAFERGQLVLHYQPQVELRSGAIVGVEALLRWQHPELGSISPSLFMPLAEQTGLIDAIGAWTLRQACIQNKAWQRAGLPPMCVAVNLSARQLEQPGLVRTIADCLADSQLEPCYLELELTESAAMRDLERTIALMRDFKRLGVQLAMDDFGSGDTNLRDLARLPIDKLKLDGSFVRDMVGNPSSFAIATTIIALAHELGMTVIAEMTETEGQAAALSRIVCDQVQGYYFARAVPPEELALLVRAGPLQVPGDRVREGHSRTLLVLDDDPDMTRAVKRAVRFDGYRVLLANRSDKAFELMACNDVGVVLCDQRLQETGGVEMLTRTKLLYPRTVRLMFSGHKDGAATSDAISQGAVSRGLSKPFDNRELRAALTGAFDAYERSAQASDGWAVA